MLYHWAREKVYMQGLSDHIRTYARAYLQKWLFFFKAIKLAGLTDFFSLRCYDFTIEILNKYFAVLNSVNSIQFHAEVSTTIAKWKKKQNGSKCTNRNTFLDFFFQEVHKIFWRHGGLQRNHSYFEAQSLRILKGTVRFFAWDILLVVE